MSNVETICEYLDRFAPPELAEEWDNTGLLVGDPTRPVARLMTCLTVTPDSAAEAIDRQAVLIVTHHPIPFRPLQRVTTADMTGSLLLQLIRHEIAVYSPHTSFDSTRGGINEMLADRLKLEEMRPLQPLSEDQPQVGSGRIGRLSTPQSASQFAETLKVAFGLDQVRLAGSPDHRVESVAVACGSGGSFLSDAVRQQASALVTGEANFHTCWEAAASGTALFLIGHFASERFAVEMLADQLSEVFPSIEVWASQQETDPLITL